MRVLLVHNFYQSSGGEDLVVRSEHDELLARGVSVVLYSRHNNEIKSFSTAQRALFPIQAIRSAPTRRDLPKILREFRPDVAYLHNLYPLISPTIYDLLRAERIPMVQALHNFRPFCANGLFLSRGHVCERCLDGSPWSAVARNCVRESFVLSSIYAAGTWKARQSLENVALFLAPSEFVRRKFIRAGLPETKVWLRPHSIDTQAVRPARQTGTYALFLGRLSPEKGVLTLLSAFRQLPELPLVVAGAGPMEATLHRFVSDHRMTNIRFAGFQENTAKWRLIEDAAFLVFPSECYETFGLPVLEGYAKSKPAIGSRIGSIPYLIRERETGLLFTPGSEAELAASARELFQDVSIRERMGRAGRLLAEESYDSRNSFDLLMSAFERSVSGPRAPQRFEVAAAAL